MLSGLWAPLEDQAPRRRGGWRQRAAADALQGDGAPAAISQLAWRQLLRWADGEVSASRLQEAMADAVADGLDHPMVVRMSRVGSGQHANAGFMDVLPDL